LAVETSSTTPLPLSLPPPLLPLSLPPPLLPLSLPPPLLHLFAAAAAAKRTAQKQALN